MTDSWWGFVGGRRQVGMLMRVTHVQRDLPLLHSLSFSLSQPHSHIPTDAPAEQAVEKRRLFAHTVPVPAAPGEYSTPPALLSPSANKPHARHCLNFLLQLQLISLCLLGLAVIRSLIHTDGYYTWYLFMAWQSCCLNSPAPIAQAWSVGRIAKKKKKPSCAPREGTKTNTNKKSVKITCMLCVTLIGTGGQNPTAVPCGQWSAGVRVQ